MVRFVDPLFTLNPAGYSRKGSPSESEEHGGSSHIQGSRHITSLNIAPTSLYFFLWSRWLRRFRVTAATTAGKPTFAGFGGSNFLGVSILRSSLWRFWQLQGSSVYQTQWLTPHIRPSLSEFSKTRSAFGIRRLALVNLDVLYVSAISNLLLRMRNLNKFTFVQDTSPEVPSEEIVVCAPISSSHVSVLKLLLKNLGYGNSLWAVDVGISFHKHHTSSRLKSINNEAGV